MRTAIVVFRVLTDMKLSEKLDGWINYLESLDAPKPEQPSIARDYPEAWEKLQKRRLILKWAWRVLWAFASLLIASRYYDLWVLEMPRRQLSGETQLLLWLSIGVTFVIYFVSEFYCPHCNKLFQHPSVKHANSILNDPQSKCMNCGLLMGERNPDELPVENQNQ